MPEALSTRLLSRRTIARDVLDMTFALQPPRTLGFRAGQFVTFPVGVKEDGTPIRRSYSVAGHDPAAGTLRFLIKVTSDGPAGAFLGPLAPGSAVEMTGPHGFFVLDERHPGDVLFAATGTGLAPVLPFLEELSARPDEPGRRVLYWGLRDEDDLFLEDELRALCDRARCELNLHLSRPSPAWSGARGRIIQPVLERAPALSAPTFYLVGSGAMIRELKAALVERGIDRKRQIRTEPFFD